MAVERAFDFVGPSRGCGSGAAPAAYGGKRRVTKPTSHQPTPDALLDLEFSTVYSRDTEGLCTVDLQAVLTRNSALRLVSWRGHVSITCSVLLASQPPATTHCSATVV